jgi:hypothetical protein
MRHRLNTRLQAKRLVRFTLWQSGELHEAQEQAEKLARAIERFRDAKGPKSSAKAMDALMRTVSRYREQHGKPDELCLGL